jgi:hypothetical protein
MVGIQTKLALAGVALTILAGAYGTGYFKGRADGRTAQLKQAVKAYETRNGIDTVVDGLGSQQLCIELGGLPDECAQLRGLDQATQGQ